jgi:hypothetical protein
MASVRQSVAGFKCEAVKWQETLLDCQELKSAACLGDEYQHPISRVAADYAAVPNQPFRLSPVTLTRLRGHGA